MENKIYTDTKDLINDLLDYKCVIYTPTFEEAEEFIHVMRDKFNMGWFDESYETYYYDWYEENTCYDWYEENTCYDFEYGANGMMNYGIDVYESTSIEVIPYSQVRNLLLNE